MNTKEMNRGATTRRRRTAPQKERSDALQDVVFLPPQPFRRNRFLLRLATIAAVVLAVVAQVVGKLC